MFKYKAHLQATNLSGLRDICTCYTLSINEAKLDMKWNRNNMKISAQMSIIRTRIFVA